MLGHWHPFEFRRVPCLGLPLSQILEARASKKTWRASPLQMGIQPEKEREEEGESERETRGKPDFQETSSRDQSEKLVLPLLFRRLFILFDRTQRSMGNTKLCSVSSPDSYRDQAFSLHTQSYTQVLGDLHHLPARRLTFYGPFLIRVCQPEDLFVLKMLFFPKSGATLRKH